MMYDHDEEEGLACVHSDTTRVCDVDGGCDACAEYVVEHEGNTWHLCEAHILAYEAEHGEVWA